MEREKLLQMVDVFEASGNGRYAGVGCDEEGTPEYLVFETTEDAEAWEEMFGGFPEGVDVDFTDGGHFCSNCGRWIPQPLCEPIDAWVDTEWGEVTCGDCLRKNESWAEDYVERLKNNPHSANHLLPGTMLQGMGWKEAEYEYENGWYGVEDSPPKIMKALNDAGKDVVFDIKDVNPFATRFTVWTKNQTTEEE